MKYYFKLFVTVFAFVLLTNCEIEEDVIVSQEIKVEKSLSTITFSELQNKIELNNVIYEIEPYLDFNVLKNPFKKSSGYEEYSINTSEVKEIIDSTYVSYTMGINNPDLPDFEFENFLIEKVNGQYQSHIMHYRPDEKYIKKLLLSGKKIEPIFSGEVVKKDLDRKQIWKKKKIRTKASCGLELTIYHIDPVSGIWYEMDDDEICENESGSCGIGWVFSGCSGTSSSGTTCTGDGYEADNNDYSNGDSNDGYTTGGGTNGSNNGPSNPGTMTSPIGNENTNLSIVDLLEVQIALNPAQLNWLDQNQSIALDIFKLILENNFSNEIKSLAKTALIDLMSYNTNNYPGKDDGYPYEWWKDDDFMDNEPLFNQTQYDQWKKLTAEEKKLSKIFPEAAIEIRKNMKEAFDETYRRFGNVQGNLNGKPDAFRHAFFNAINTRDTNPKVTLLFSNAHESEVPTRWDLEKEMDLYNNVIGISIGDSVSSSTSNSVISTDVFVALISGELRYLSPINYSDPNFSDNPLTNEPNDGTHGISINTNLIPTNQ